MFRGEFYQNSHGLAQIKVSAHGDTVDEMVERTALAWKKMEEKAKKAGIELVST